MLLANIAVALMFIYAIGTALAVHGVSATGRDVVYYSSTTFSLAVLVCNMLFYARRD
jgi:hypothetical protein